MSETWFGTTAGKKKAKGIWVGTAAGRKEVQKAWVGTPAGNKLVYTRVPDMVTVLSANPVSSSRIDLSWTATPGCTYFLEGTSGLKQDMGTALAKQNTGLTQKTKYNYRVDVLFEGQKIGESHASATTPAVPVPATSSGSVNGPSLISSGGWTESTARNLVGPQFTLHGYVSSFNLYLGAHYSGGTWRVDPYVGGTRLGWRTGTGSKGWKHVDGKNTAVGGAFRVGAHAGGTSGYATAWQAYTGVTWNYNVACGTINYWWYTRAADGRSVQSEQPWWTDDLAGVDIHVESWVDAEGNPVRAVITDKESGELLHEWEG